MSGTRRAAVIGVNNYGDHRIENLRGAVNDAEEIHDRLTKYGDFEIAPEHFLLNERATSGNLRRVMSDLLWRVKSEVDLTLIYFSGHGFVDSYNVGYIAPHDMVYDEPLVNGIRMDHIRDLLLAAKQKKTILVILDCCYSGIAADASVRGDRGSSSITEGFAPLADLDGSAEGRLLYASAGKDQFAKESDAFKHRLTEATHYHGSFTFQLLEGLDGGALDDSDTAISVDSLVAYVDRQFLPSSDQRPRRFGSALQGSPWLARSTLQGTVGDRVGTVRTYLEDSGDSTDLIRACRDLKPILSESPGSDLAKALRRDIDEELKRFQNSCIDYLLSEELQISNKCTNAFFRLQELALQLNYVKLASVDDDTRLCGLLANLLRISQQPEDNWSKNRSMIQQLLVNYEAWLADKSQAPIKLPSPGRRNA